MNNKKKVILSRGLLCTTLLFPQVNEAWASKGSKKPARQVSHARPGGNLKKRTQPPPELWSRLRSKLTLPRPAPVQWSAAMLETLASLPEKMKIGGDSRPAQADPGRSAAPINLRVSTRTGVADARAVDLSISREATHTPAIAGVKAGEGVQPLRTPAEASEQSLSFGDDQLIETVLELQRQAAAHDRYLEQVQWFSRRMGFVRHAVERATPYLYLIIEELESRKLPVDLALLPILESGYEPRAVSPKSASGIWQFMAGTGRDYGLIQTEWYDGRLDIAASTRAAVRFLAHLSRRFQGDWLLALAAYNCGERRVEQAIAANQATNLPTDFWSLKLPDETMAYVPRLLALSTIFGNPKAYGLALSPLPFRPALVKVRFEHTLPVAEVSRLAGMSVEEFTHLNPGFIGGMVAAEGPSELWLPESKRTEFQERLEFAALTQAAVEPVLLAKNEQVQYCSANPLLD